MARVRYFHFHTTNRIYSHIIGSNCSLFFMSNRLQELIAIFNDIDLAEIGIVQLDYREVENGRQLT